MIPRSITIFTLVLCTGFALVGCESVPNPFGTNQEIKLPGKRLTVLSNRAQLSVAPAVSALRYSAPSASTIAQWSQPYANSQHYLGNINGASAAKNGLQAVWHVDIGKGQSNEIPLQSLPIVVGDRAYAMDTEYTVTAWDLTTGDNVWRAEDDSDTPYRISYGGGISYGQGHLIISTGYGDVMALDATDGSVVWRQVLRVPIRGAATVIGNLAIIQTLDSQAFALDIQDGSESWYHAGINEITSVINQTSATGDKDRVFLAYNSGEVAAVNTQDGTVIWVETLSNSQRISELSQINTISASPVLLGDKLLVSSYSDQMLLMQTSNGRRLWSQRIGSLSVPLVAGDSVFVLANDQRLYALETTSGRVRWINNPNHMLALKLRENAHARGEEEDVSNEIATELTPNEIPQWYWSAPVMIDSELLSINQNGDVLRIDPQNGQHLGYQKLEEGSAYPPVVVGKQILLLSPQGQLTLYQ